MLRRLDAWFRPGRRGSSARGSWFVGLMLGFTSDYLFLCASVPHSLFIGSMFPTCVINISCLCDL